MITCVGCSTEFVPTRKNQKFHSRVCYQNNTVKLKTCPQCGTAFKRKFSDQKCCTPKCGFAYRAKNKIKGSDIPCSFCGKPIYKMKSRQKKDNFCNNDCKYAWLRSDKNPYKNRKHPQEEIEKIKQANLNRNYNLIFTKKTRQKLKENAKNTINRPDIIEKTKKINRERLKGTTLPEEQKQKIKAKARYGEDNNKWMGDFASYYAMHAWVKRHIKTLKICVDKDVLFPCKGRLELSNKDHKYRRNVDDYQWRCTRHHRIYDMQHRLVNPKGKAARCYALAGNIGKQGFTIDGIIIDKSL